MSISGRTQNKKSTDPFDQLIFEKGLKIKTVLIDKELDLILLVLNNGIVIKEAISNYSGLQKASTKSLNNWRLIAGGTGISWEKLNEDLSLKGFIKNSALQKMLQLPARERNKENTRVKNIKLSRALNVWLQLFL